jgi:large subunit ribosomal protein L6
MIVGTTDGFQKTLEIVGIGYKAALNGKKLNLSLGYSHDINYDIEDGITVEVPNPTTIVVSGIDKQRVGEVAAQIRGYRKPEPYKGKGIRYKGEKVAHKEGKTAVSGS